jgi:hypothetical protein
MGSPFSRSASWGEHNDVELSVGCRPAEAAALGTEPAELVKASSWRVDSPSAALAEGYAPRASR